MLGAPDIRSGFTLGYATLAVALLSFPALTALFIEAPLMMLADRIGRRRVAIAGFIVFGLAGFGAACSQTGWQLALALAVSANAGGVALGVSQASMMDADPDRRELWMTRWTLFGSLGDLAAPALLALLAACSLGWRAGFVVVGVAALACAIVAWR